MPSANYAIARCCDPFSANEARRLYPGCPERFITALERYVNVGLETGGFLRSVLENDLIGAVARADEASLAVLSSLCGVVVFCVPEVACGSRAAVALWLLRRPSDDGGLTQPSAPDEQ